MKAEGDLEVKKAGEGHASKRWQEPRYESNNVLKQGINSDYQQFLKIQVHKIC